MQVNENTSRCFGSHQKGKIKQEPYLDLKLVIGYTTANEMFSYNYSSIQSSILLTRRRIEWQQMRQPADAFADIKQKNQTRSY